MNGVCANQGVLFAELSRSKQFSDSLTYFKAAGLTFRVVARQFLRIILKRAYSTPLLPQPVAVIFKRSPLLPF
jgi:hypothetical protein